MAQNLHEIYALSKQDGHTTIHRLADPQLVALIQEGDKPGTLRRQKLITGQSIGS